MTALNQALVNLCVEPQLERITGCLTEAAHYLARHANKLGIKEVNMLLLGGAALHVSGYRSNFSDVDILVKELPLQTALPTSMIKVGEPKTDVEFGFDLKMGSLDDPLAFNRADKSENVTINGVSVNISVYPEAYSLLLKMEHARSKCENDIQRLLMGIEPDEIIKAFNNLVKVNDAWVMNDLADMLVTDYAMLATPGAMQGDKLEVLGRVCSELNICDDKRKDLKMIHRALSLQHNRANKVARQAEDGLAFG